MARLTKKLLAEIWADTTVCYRKALRDEYPELLAEYDDPRIEEFKYERSVEAEMKEIVYANDLPLRSPTINDRYLAYLKKLDTKTLDLVIEAHRKQKQRRAEVTIAALATELFERAVTKQ